MAAWLVRSSPDRALRVQAGFKPASRSLRCVLGQDTLLAQCLSPPRFTNEYRRVLGGSQFSFDL